MSYGCTDFFTRSQLRGCPKGHCEDGALGARRSNLMLLAFRQRQRHEPGAALRRSADCHVARLAPLARNCGNCAPAVIANPASGGVKQSHVVAFHKIAGSRWPHGMRLLRPSSRLRQAEGLAMTRRTVSFSNYPVSRGQRLAMTGSSVTEGIQNIRPAPRGFTNPGKCVTILLPSIPRRSEKDTT